MFRNDRKRNYKSNLKPYQKREIKRQLWARSQKCGICNKQLPCINRSTLDHIVPLSKNGADDISNIQLTHWKCNNDKGNNHE